MLVSMLPIFLNHTLLIGLDFILEVVPDPHELVLVFDLEVHLEKDFKGVNVVGQVEFLIKR